MSFVNVLPEVLGLAATELAGVKLYFGCGERGCGDAYDNRVGSGC